MAPNPDRELIEAALPSYEIGIELGRGAWGVVLSGRHKRLDRLVAIKQLPRAFAADPDVRERFLREARMAAALEHPHIVPVYDYVEQDGLALIVMEQCPSTLAARFHGDGVATDEACASILATCSALAYAHQEGVLHRDIKPENLLLDDEGIVKLGDFGIARAADAATRLTATGTVVGTPAYMSPEQAGGEDMGPPSDVYSSGVVLYELLSGALPFADVQSLGALLRQHMFEPPRPLLDVAPGIPQRIAAVVDRSLVKDPAQRWATATDFGIALGEATAHAFGAGWLRQRRFSLLGAPDILAATERQLDGGGRAGTVIVRAPSSAGPVAAAGTPTMAPQATPPDVAVEDQPMVGEGAQAGPPMPPLAPQPGAPSQGHEPRIPAPVDFQPTSSAAAASAGDAPGGGSRRSESSRTPVWIAIGCVVVAVVAGLAVLLASTGGDGTVQVNAQPSDDEAQSDVADDGSVAADPDASSTQASSDEPAAAQPDGVPATDPEGAAPAGGQPGLVIGSLVDNSTDRADDLRVAMDLAVADVAEAGGAAGAPVEFLEELYSDEAAMVLGVDRLSELGASVIVGPSDPVDTGAVLPTITSLGVLAISPTDFFGREDPTGLYFQTQVPATLVARAAVSQVPAGTGHLAVLADGDNISDLDRLVRDAITDQAQSQGMSSFVVDVIGDDVESAAAQVAAGSPEGVLIVDLVGLAEVYQALINAGVGPSALPYVVSGGLGGASEMDDGQIAGVVEVTGDALTGDALEGRLQAVELSADAAQAYDAVVIAALAAEQAGSFAPLDLAAQLPLVTANGQPCTSFAECKELIGSGTDIDYVGPGGPYEIGAADGQPTAGYFRRAVIGESGFSLGDSEQFTFRR